MHSILLIGDRQSSQGIEAGNPCGFVGSTGIRTTRCARVSRPLIPPRTKTYGELRTDTRNSASLDLQDSSPSRLSVASEFRRVASSLRGPPTLRKKVGKVSKVGQLPFFIDFREV